MALLSNVDFLSALDMLAEPAPAPRRGLGEIDKASVTGAASGGVGFVVGLTVGVVGTLLGVAIYRDAVLKQRAERRQGFRYS